jgi:peptide/nickel transport system substrate-binding protein
MESRKRLRQREKKERNEKKIILGVLKKKPFPLFSQFKYLPHFLSKKEKMALAFFGAMAIFALLGFGVQFYFNNTKIMPASGGEYSEGIIDYPRLIIPLYSQSNPVDKDMVSLIYSGLTAWTARGGIALDLAKEAKVSDDEKTYTYVLRSDAVWHDGKPLTADDVVFTIRAIKNEKYNSPLRAAWEEVEIKKINDSTVQFRLKKPYSMFPSLLTVGIMPKHIWEQTPIANIAIAPANKQPVGTGPYKFKSFTVDKTGVIKNYILARNTAYYGQKPNIETINLKFYPDYISAVNALDNNQIDGLAFVPVEARSVLKLRNRFNAHDITLPQLNAVFFNAKNNALLKDKNIRRALIMAVNKKKIISDAADDYANLIDGPILPDFPGYNGAADSGASSDKDAAQKILMDAGWVFKDAEKFRTNKKKEALKITLTTIDKDQNVRAARIIKEDWEAIGVAVDLKIAGAGNISKEVIDGRNYEALLYGEMYGPELDIYQYWHASAIKFPGLNLAQYSNPKTDILLEAARQTSDKLVREKKYKEFQSLLLEDFPAIFLWQPKYAYFIDKKLQGVEITTLLTPSDRFKYILSGYINTKRSFK